MVSAVFLTGLAGSSCQGGCNNTLAPACDDHSPCAADEQLLCGKICARPQKDGDFCSPDPCQQNSLCAQGSVCKQESATRAACTRAPEGGFLLAECNELAGRFCAYGLVCACSVGNPGQGTCSLPGAEGDTCTLDTSCDNTHCGPGLACTDAGGGHLRCARTCDRDEDCKCGTSGQVIDGSCKDLGGQKSCAGSCVGLGTSCDTLTPCCDARAQCGATPTAAGPAPGTAASICCLAPNERCSFNRDCCQGPSTAMVCRSGPDAGESSCQTCVESAASGCNRNDQCCTKGDLCLQGKCLRPDGQSCTDKSQCQSNDCFCGVCGAHPTPLGAQCTLGACGCKGSGFEAACVSSNTAAGGSVCTVPLCEACTGQGQCRSNVAKTTALCEQGVCCRDGGSVCDTTDECCSGLACVKGKCKVQKGAQHQPCSSTNPNPCKPLGGACRLSSDCCGDTNSCVGGICQPQPSVYKLLSYLHSGPTLTEGASPDLSYEFTADDGIPVALGGSDISKGPLEAVYVATRLASQDSAGNLLAIDVSGTAPKIGFSQPLPFAPTAFEIVHTDSGGGNPQDLTVVLGHAGGATFCVVDVDGSTAYKIDHFTCKDISFSGTAVAVRSRFPHDGFVSIVTSDKELLNVTFNTSPPTLLFSSPLDGVPTGLTADSDFAWVTLGSFVQKFNHTGGPAVQTKDLGGPALAVAGVGAAVPIGGTAPPGGAALLTWLGVATQTSPTASTTSLFSFEQGKLAGTLQQAPGNAEGLPVAMTMRSYQGAPFAYVAISGSSPVIRASSLPSGSPASMKLPTGQQPIDLIVAGSSADPAAGLGPDPDATKQNDDCSSVTAGAGGTTAGSCQSGTGFLHVLVRQ